MNVESVPRRVNEGRGTRAGDGKERERASEKREREQREK
jgi:hypothetical protein